MNPSHSYRSSLRRVVVASDSFKGSLSSMQVAEAVECGINDICPSCEVIKLSVADGGEGTLESLMTAMGGTLTEVEVHDPLGRAIRASYGLFSSDVVSVGHSTINQSGDLTAVIELSAASGLCLLTPEERNPLATSTYGTGELIADALSRGCRRFLMCIGGSATNDAGMGMLSALGYRFLDAGGSELKGIGADIANVSQIDDSNVFPGLSDSEFIVACDVDSPFCGSGGAACVYAPQKGADSEMVAILDQGMTHFSGIIAAHTGVDITDLPGAGAAGGVGGAMVAFFHACLERGADMVLDAIRFDSLISDADLVVTGEGSLDFQTLTGKLPYRVAERATCAGVPVVAVCGTAQISECSWLDAIIPVTPESMPLDVAIRQESALANIRSAVSSFLLSFSV